MSIPSLQMIAPVLSNVEVVYYTQDLLELYHEKLYGKLIKSKFFNDKQSVNMVNVGDSGEQ